MAVLAGEGGADLILDMVGGDYIARNLKTLADDGRLVQIAFLQGPKAEINFAPLMMRRQTITGSTLRPQIEAGRLAPVMDSEFPLEAAAEAHRRIESSGHIGKIVLKVGG